MALTAIVALLAKVAPLIFQLLSILISTEVSKNTKAIEDIQKEEANLEKTGRPTWS